MDEIHTSPDSMRHIWLITDDMQSPHTDTSRWRLISRPHVWRPLTDVFEIEDAIIIRVEVAGMQEADFSIALVDRNLTIRGIRQDTSERRAYHQMEIPFGEFITEVGLPYAVIPDKVEATYRDGFLRIILPVEQPRHIKVEGQ